MTPPERFFSKPPLRNRNTIFTLGNRGSVIGGAELEGPIIVPHTAQKSDVRVSGQAGVGAGRRAGGLDGRPTQLPPPHFQYPFESLFRSQHYALLDNSCREYLFLCDFFLVTGTPALDLFHAVMGKTLAMFLVSWGLPVPGNRTRVPWSGVGREAQVVPAPFLSVHRPVWGRSRGRPASVG